MDTRSEEVRQQSVFLQIGGMCSRKDFLQRMFFQAALMLFAIS